MPLSRFFLLNSCLWRKFSVRPRARLFLERFQSLITRETRPEKAKSTVACALAGKQLVLSRSTSFVVSVHMAIRVQNDEGNGNARRNCQKK